MVGKGRDHVFANLVRSGEQRVARERVAAVVQIPPAGQDEFAPSAQHFVRNQGAPPRPDLLSSLLSAQRQGQRQEDPRDTGTQPRPEVLGPLLAAQQVYPQDQAEQVARGIEARIQKQNIEAQQGDEGQAQVLANRPQGVQPNQQALSRQQHQSNAQEAALRHHENQIAHIIDVSTPTPTRAQAEHILRHQRIRFTQVSHWTAEELRIRRLLLQNIASFWQVLAAIEVIPAVILPGYVHVPEKLRGLVDPTDLKTWDGRILDRLYALAELTPGRPESVAALLQQSVRRRRVQGLGHDCLTLWDVEDVLRDIQSRQQSGGTGGSEGGEARQDFTSQPTLSSSGDEGDDNNQGGAGATRGNQQNHLINDPTPANGHAGFVALTGGYGLNSSSDTSESEADKNGTRDVETKHSLSANAPSSRPRTRSQTSACSLHSDLHRFPPPDPVAEARAYDQRTQQDRLRIQYMQRLRANRSSPYNSDVSSNSTPSSSDFQIGPDGLPVRDAEEDDDEMHIGPVDEVGNGEEASSRPRTRSQPSAASNRSSHSDLYRDPSPETVTATRAIRLENANAHVNGGQNARGGQNVEDDGDTTLVNAGGTSIGGTTLVDNGEMDGPRSTSVAPSTPSDNERPRAIGLYNRFVARIDRMGGSRARQHDGIPRPRNVEFVSTDRDSAETDVDTTLEVAGEGSSRIVLSRTPSTPSANRPCTRSQTSAASHQSSSSNGEEAVREAEEEQRLTDAHEAARHAFETRHARTERVPLIDRMMDGYLGDTPREGERRQDHILRNFAVEQGQAHDGDSAFGEEVDYAVLNNEEVGQGGEEEPAREEESFPSYAAVTTPPQRNDTEARNSSQSRKRRRTRSWGSQTFKPSSSKKRKTKSPEFPTASSRTMTPPQSRKRGASLLSSAPRTPSPSSSRSGEAEMDIPSHITYDQMTETGTRAAAAGGEQSGSEQVEEDQSEGETEEENEEAQDEDTNDENEADDKDDDKDDNHVHISTDGEEKEGKKTPSSSSSSSSSSLPSSLSSDEEDLFPSSSSGSSSYVESDSNERLPSNVTDSDHESYDFTPSPSPLAQGQNQDVYDEMQADEDAYYQFIQEQYGESIADFFRNIDRQDGRERPETGDELDALGDFYQAQHVRSSPIEEHTGPRSASSSSSIRSLNNAYDNARRTSTADERMRELSGRPRTGSGDLDYDGTRLGSELSQSISSDKLRSVSGASRTTRSSSASGSSGAHVGDMYMGRRITKVIRLRAGESILVKVAPKDS